MNDFELVKKGLKKYFEDINFISLREFLDVESVLSLLYKVSPYLNPELAYVLLRNYHLINSSQIEGNAFYMQKARVMFMHYSSRLEWERVLELYFDDELKDIRLYNCVRDKLVFNNENILFANRREIYLNRIFEYVPPTYKISNAKPGSYNYKKDNGEIETVTFELPPIESSSNGQTIKGERENISVTIEELLEASKEMKHINSDSHHYDVLNRNLIKLVQNGKVELAKTVEIKNLVNVVGMVGAGKTTFLQVLAYYAAKKDYKTVIVMNSINDVLHMYWDLRKFGLMVSPLIGRSEQEKHISALVQGDEDFLNEEYSKYLLTPCIVDGLNSNSQSTLKFKERPCYSLQANKSQYRCPYFDICPGTAMLREAVSSQVVVTTVAGMAAANVGANRELFLKTVLDTADIVIFDECDRVQMTLDSFFAPAVSFGDFIHEQADACAMDMKQPVSDESDRNKDVYFGLVRQAKQIHQSIARILNQIRDDKKWGNLVKTTFSALTLIRQLEEDGVNNELTEALHLIVRAHDNDNLNDYGEELLQLSMESCCLQPHEKGYRTRLENFLNIHGIINDKSIKNKTVNHILLVFRIIRFDKFMEEVDGAAKAIENSMLEKNSLSNFLHVKFSSQQKYLPSAPMGNTFGLIYGKDNSLKVYRQFAYGRILMTALPWLKLNECGKPNGPHTILLSGSSYAEGSLQYHVNAPVNYILEAPDEHRNYLKQSKFSSPGALTVVSGGGIANRIDNIAKLLYEIRMDIEAELGRDGKILFVVNSYREAEAACDEINNFLSAIDSREKCVTLINDSSTRTKDVIKRDQLTKFAQRVEKILIAPAVAIERGYNIVDKNGNSAIRSVFFLVRPMGVPDDISAKIGKINGYIAAKFSEGKIFDWGEFADNVKNAAGRYWNQIENSAGKTLAFLDEEQKTDIVATVMILLQQIFGRVARIGQDDVGSKCPPRVYFADGAFRPKTGNTSFDIIEGIKDYLEKQMSSENGEIAKTLYEIFYNALKEGINYEQDSNTNSVDDLYSETDDN